MKMQSWLIRGFAGALFVFAAQAQAALLLTPAGTTCTTNVTSNLNEAAVESLVSSCFEKSLDLTLLYKANVDDGSEEGSFSPSYQTTFLDTPTDPSGALIDYIGGLAITCPECFLLVKDGNQTPAQYLFDIGNWNGTQDISLAGFWPDRGAISNVAIWGVPGRTVAEPATLAMLGLGLLGLGVLRRRQE